MSLIHRRHAILAGAAALAIFTPLAALRTQPTLVAPIGVPLVATKLDIKMPEPLSAAFSAPLFSPTRSVMDLPVEGAAPSAEETPPAPRPSLVGIVFQARGRGVAIVKAADGTTATLAPGETIVGWTLQSVGRDKATFSNGADRYEARLDFSNAPTQAVNAISPDAPIPLPPPAGEPLVQSPGSSE